MIKPKILFDYQIFGTQKFGGISRFFVQLLESFYKDKIVDFKLPIFYSENEYLIDTKFSRNFYFLKDKKFKGRDRLLDLFFKINRFNSIQALKKGSFDVFHPTYYNAYFLDHIKDKPFVVTIYDMIHEIYANKFFSSNDPVITNKKKLAEKAAKIIAISHSTKRDIINYYGIDENKIEVVYCASSLDSKKFQDLNVPERFLLIVGGKDNHKNFYFFMSSIIPLLKRDRSLMIVYAGMGDFTNKEIDLFNQNEISKRVLHYKVNDMQLVFLYKKALAFIYPSLYEGFGIPVLEAFSCGCPAVISSTSSMPEVGGDAAIYFNPENSNSIIESISNVIYDQDMRNKLIVAGLKRESAFSWDISAKKLRNIYCDIL